MLKTGVWIKIYGSSVILKMFLSKLKLFQNKIFRLYGLWIRGKVSINQCGVKKQHNTRCTF